MTSALSLSQSPSRWGLTGGKDCTHAAMRAERVRVQVQLAEREQHEPSLPCH